MRRIWFHAAYAAGLRPGASRSKSRFMGQRIYKVLTKQQWAAAEAGALVRAPVDVEDGYVHFSTRTQLKETLAKWFRGVDGCVLASFDSEVFEHQLKWEKARGGDKFKHVYGEVRASQALSIWLLELDADGTHLRRREPQRHRSALLVDGRTQAAREPRGGPRGGQDGRTFPHELIR